MSILPFDADESAHVTGHADEIPPESGPARSRQPSGQIAGGPRALGGIGF